MKILQVSAGILDHRVTENNTIRTCFQKFTMVGDIIYNYKCLGDHRKGKDQLIREAFQRTNIWVEPWRMEEILPSSKRERAFQKEETRAKAPARKKSWARWGRRNNHEGLWQKVKRRQQKTRLRGTFLTFMYKWYNMGENAICLNI